MSCAGYLDAIPEGTAKGVVVLIHGFPDISLAWRYQVPLLLKLKFRCIALESMGYGETVSRAADPSSSVKHLAL
jgi:pimeloyl-ACP methyl ester carboxylesterase